MTGIVRSGDLDSGHNGAVAPLPISNCSTNVIANGLGAALSGTSTFPNHNIPPLHSNRIATGGSSNVFINGQPAYRKDDPISCGDHISQGSANIFVN